MLNIKEMMVWGLGTAAATLAVIFATIYFITAPMLAAALSIAAGAAFFVGWGMFFATKLYNLSATLSTQLATTATTAVTNLNNNVGVALTNATGAVNTLTHNVEEKLTTATAAVTTTAAKVQNIVNATTVAMTDTSAKVQGVLTATQTAVSTFSQDAKQTIMKINQGIETTSATAQNTLLTAQAAITTGKEQVEKLTGDTTQLMSNMDQRFDILTGAAMHATHTFVGTANTIVGSAQQTLQDVSKTVAQTADVVVELAAEGKRKLGVLEEAVANHKKESGIYKLDHTIGRGANKIYAGTAAVVTAVKGAVSGGASAVTNRLQAVKSTVFQTVDASSDSEDEDMVEEYRSATEGNGRFSPR